MPDAMMTVSEARLGAAMKATEEALGDLKLYRVPERVTVAAKGLKQVAFLDEQVEARMLYRSLCSPWDARPEALGATMLLTTVNDKEHGLGVALPMGGLTVFEPSSFGEQLVAEDRLRDYADGQDIELDMGTSGQVFGRCQMTRGVTGEGAWMALYTVLTNANPNPVRIRLVLGSPASWQLRGLAGTRVKDGLTILEVTVPGNGQREIEWEARQTGAG